MKFDFSKSVDSDLQNKFQSVLRQLDYILGEQRHQRIDLARLIRMIETKENNDKLQSQVDDYLERDDAVSSELDDK